MLAFSLLVEQPLSFCSLFCSLSNDFILYWRIAKFVRSGIFTGGATFGNDNSRVIACSVGLEVTAESSTCATRHLVDTEHFLTRCVLMIAIHLLIVCCTPCFLLNLSLQ